MTGLEGLDIAIGLAFIFAVLSLITSALVELTVQKLGIRSDNLRSAVEQLLNDQGQSGASAPSERLYEHPLIRGLFRGTRGPSYVPSRQFARALLQLVPKSGGAQGGAAASQATAQDAPSRKIATVLEAFREEAGGDMEKVRTLTAQWFDDTMARSSGWFRRRINKFLILFGVIVTVAANADTLQIIQTLSVDSAIRSQLVEHATSRVGSGRNDGAAAGEAGGGAAHTDAAESWKEQLDVIAPVLGWSHYDATTLIGPVRDVWRAWVLKIIGLGLTSVAVSLGAPFWFDLLGRLVSLRGSVRESLTNETGTGEVDSKTPS